MGGTGRSAAMKSVHGAEAIVTFYTNTILAMVTYKNTVLDQHLRSMFTYLTGGVIGIFAERTNSRIISNASVGDYLPTSRMWLRSSCMIVSQICCAAILSPPFLNSVCEAMCTSIAKYRVDDRAFTGHDGNGFVGDVTNPMEDVLMAMLVVVRHQKV